MLYHKVEIALKFQEIFNFKCICIEILIGLLLKVIVHYTLKEATAMYIQMDSQL